MWAQSCMYAWNLGAIGDFKIVKIDGADVLCAIMLQLLYTCIQSKSNNSCRYGPFKSDSPADSTRAHQSKTN